MVSRLSIVVLLLFVSAASVNAQSTYVGASLIGDVLRRAHTESNFGGDFSADGEAIGFALRIGTPLGSRWGIELEFARPGEIESDFTGGPIPLGQRSGTGFTWTSSGSGTILSGLFEPSSQLSIIRSTSRQRYTTLSTSAWVHQDLTNRFALVYLAGMGFYRSTTETEIRFDPSRGGIGGGVGFPSLPIIFPPMDTKTVSYGVRPLAGIEARVGLTDNVDLVPGARLHGVEGGWLLRPAVGLDWKF